MENDTKLLEQIEKLFKDNGVKVIRVDGPKTIVNGEEILVYTRRCELDWIQDTLRTIESEKMTEIYIYEASRMLLDGNEFVTYRANWKSWNAKEAK